MPSRSLTRQRLLKSLQEGQIPTDHSGQPLSLCGADLRGALLTSRDLRRLDLRSADLSGAILDGANLSGADLSGANLTGASLRGANLIGTDLSEATLHRACLVGANLYRSCLDRAVLRAANLQGAGLNEARLRGSDLSGASLADSNLIRSTLHGARLSHANLHRAYLSEAVLSQAVLEGADLREANLSGADISGTDLSRADLQKANLSACLGKPFRRENARLSTSTWQRSGWSTADLIDWLQAGGILTDPGALPQSERHHLFAVQLGLTLKFRVNIQPTDWFALYAFLTAYTHLHPDTNLRIVAFQGTDHATTVRLLSEQHDTLVDFAEALAERSWEQDLASAGSLICTLKRMAPDISRHLSWLLDRGERFELYTIENSALRKVRQWSIDVEPADALARLLDNLFSSSELDQWLSARAVPVSPSSDRSLRDVVASLTRRGRIDAELFSDLILQAPEKIHDIQAIQSVWTSTPAESAPPSSR